MKLEEEEEGALMMKIKKNVIYDYSNSEYDEETKEINDGKKSVVCKKEVEADVFWARELQHPKSSRQKTFLAVSPNSIRTRRFSYSKENSSSSLWGNGSYVPDYEVRFQRVK